MIYLNFDQSTKITAYSVFNSTGELLDYGIVNSNVKENNSILRMKIMAELIEKLIEKYKPDYCCIEGVQFQHNYNTYSTLSQMQGVIFQILFKRNIPFSVISPVTWRKYSGVKGAKREELKGNAIRIAESIYNLQGLTDDEADSILIGRYAINNIKEIQK